MQKILLIEDDEDIATAYSDILTKAGYEVSWATDGHAGVRSVASFRPDLILLDLFMPIFSGIEFLEVLHQVPELDMPKIIVCTNLLSPESNSLAKSLGASTCIIKAETSVDELLDLIGRTLQSKTTVST